jgi:hypothetical protein
MATLMGQSCWALVDQVLLVDYICVQRCLCTVVVAANLCGPARSPSFKELQRTSHHRARCMPLYRRVLVFCIASALFWNIKHFIIYVVICNSRTHVITLLFGLCMRCIIHQYFGVADSLSRKHRCNHLIIQPHTSCCDPEEPSLWVVVHDRLNNIALIPTIKKDGITTQRTDVGMGHIHQRLELGEAQCFWQDVDGVLWFKDRLVVLKDFELRRKIIDEAHCFRYYIHPGTNKIYQDLKKSF